MEPIAVNHVTVTKELFAESHDAIFSLRRQKTLLWAGIIFALCGAVLLLLQSRLPQAAGMGLPLLLTGCVVILWALTLKKSDLRKKYRVFQQKHGDASARTVLCDRTGLTVDTGTGEPVRIEYTDIRSHLETPHLYLLICADHVGVQLARDGFETGSWETLLQAIDRAREEAVALAELT